MARTTVTKRVIESLMPGATAKGLPRDWQTRAGSEHAIPDAASSRIQTVVSSAVSDEALLAGLAAGDADAATAFTRRFQARVYGLVLTIVRDEGTAEDVAQETFVRAWKHARTFDPRRGRVATWLLTIARNLAIDVVRVRPAEPLDPDLVATKLQQGGVAGSPADHGLPPDERERVRGTIAELPPEQRRALFLAVYLGRTAQEVGELEAIPLGTPKTRIRTAMLKLRDSLETRNEV
jgi:RNA polymerase sigma factor (sigma-70 family)